MSTLKTHPHFGHYYSGYQSNVHILFTLNQVPQTHKWQLSRHIKNPWHFPDGSTHCSSSAGLCGCLDI